MSNPNEVIEGWRSGAVYLTDLDKIITIKEVDNIHKIMMAEDQYKQPCSYTLEGNPLSVGARAAGKLMKLLSGSDAYERRNT